MSSGMQRFRVEIENPQVDISEAAYEKAEKKMLVQFDVWLEEHDGRVKILGTDFGRTKGTSLDRDEMPRYGYFACYLRVFYILI